jgi:hypothetical protein
MRVCAQGSAGSRRCMASEVQESLGFQLYVSVAGPYDRRVARLMTRRDSEGSSLETTSCEDARADALAARLFRTRTQADGRMVRRVVVSANPPRVVLPAR